MSQETIPSNTEAAILERILDSQVEDLGEQEAHYLLRLKFPTPDAERINELFAKAQEGTLGPDEEAELDSYLHVDSLLSFMQSKARQALKNSNASS